jgi:hypothetical protein
MPDVSMCIYMLVIGEGREEKGARTRHKEKASNMQSHARARTHVKNSLSFFPRYAQATRAVQVVGTWLELIRNRLRT